MSELAAYHAVLLGWLALSVITFVTLFFRTAPYGRHTQRGWGPTVAPRWGWLLMEAPAALVIAGFALPAIARADWPQGWLLIGMWELHYINRAFVFPFRLRSTRPMPVAVVAMAIGFNFMNGWINARGLTVFGPELGRAALTSPRVLAGTALFLVGLAINWDADARLLRMPRSADGGYTIPRGGLYERISCPNYFGEIIEWTGFALAAGSLAALGFVVWTLANLAPRAISHHAWYKKEFPDYPSSRRALIPYVW